MREGEERILQKMKIMEGLRIEKKEKVAERKSICYFCLWFNRLVDKNNLCLTGNELWAAVYCNTPYIPTCF